MILRKIYLEDRKALIRHEFDLSRFFDDRLILWFDKFTKEDVKKLDDFLLENYHLKYEDKSESLKDKSMKLIEYANNSLYFHHNEGNLIKHYDKLQVREHCLRYPENNENDPVTHANKIKEYFTKTTERELKSEISKGLEEYLKQGSFVTVSIINDLKYLNYTSHHMDAPYDYGNRIFQPTMLKLSLMPVKNNILRGLTGLLVGQGLDYETPRHKEIFEGIIKGNIKEYSGNAYYEHNKKVA